MEDQVPVQPPPRAWPWEQDSGVVLHANGSASCHRCHYWCLSRSIYTHVKKCVKKPVGEPRVTVEDLMSSLRLSTLWSRGHVDRYHIALGEQRRTVMATFRGGRLAMAAPACAGAAGTLGHGDDEEDAAYPDTEQGEDPMAISPQRSPAVEQQQQLPSPEGPQVQERQQAHRPAHSEYQGSMPSSSTVLSLPCISTVLLQG